MNKKEDMMSHMNKKSGVAGLLLIVLGILLLTGKYIPQVDSSETLFSVYWPSMTILFIGMVLHLIYMLTEWKGNEFLLIPGGILVALGIFFQISVHFEGWVYMWPTFILAPAIGIGEYYFLGGRPKWALIPIGALISVSCILLLVFTVGHFVNYHAVQLLVAFLFIVFGVFILFGSRAKRTIGR
ncbi:hypothetical protein D3C76_1270100 [compost metagenome]